MNKIINPFIILTDDYESISQSLDDDGSITKFLSTSIGDPEKFFLAPNRGEVLSLEHDFVTGRVKIELLDIDRRFEERFMTPQFTKWMQGMPSKNDIENKRIRNTLADTALYLIYGTDVNRPYFGGPSAFFLNGYNISESVDGGKIITIEITGTSSYQNLPNTKHPGIRNILTPFKEQLKSTFPIRPFRFAYLNSTAPQIQKALQNEIEKTLRDDLIDMSVGETILEFLSTASVRAAGAIGFGDGSTANEAFERSITLKRFESQVLTYFSSFNNSVFSDGNLLLHFPVTQCIRKFLQSAFSTKNVIVFIKNLEETHSSIIRKEVDSLTVDKVAKIVELIKSSESIPDEEINQEKKSPDKPYWEAVERILGYIGMEMVVNEDNIKNKDYAPLPYEASVENLRKSKWVKKFVSELNVDISVCIKAENRMDGAGAYRENNAAVKEAIENVIRKIEEYSSVENKQKLHFYVETNTNIISLWKNAGIIDNEEDPVIILADQDIHSMFLYPSLAQSLEIFTGATKDTLIKNHSINEADFALFSPLMSPKYAQDYYKITYRGLSSAYREGLPYGGPEERAAYFDYPIFRYNVENPNVTELEVNFNGLLLGHLMRAIEVRNDYLSQVFSKLDNPLVNKDFTIDLKNLFVNYDSFLLSLKNLRRYTIEKSDEEFKEWNSKFEAMNFTSREEMYISNLASYLGSSYGLSEEAIRLLGKSTIYTMAQQIYRMQVASTKNPDYKILIEETVLTDPEHMALDMFRHTLNETGMYEVKLKTLPYFGMDTPLFINKPVVLVANALNVINEALGQYPKSILTRYLSGFYYIKEFSHTIQEGELFSEFTLIRPPTSFEVPIDDIGINRGPDNPQDLENLFNNQFDRSIENRYLES